jgi:hypothetical protein
MTLQNFQTDLARALHMADIADEITLRHYRSDDLNTSAKVCADDTAVH